jgi:tetratricopeptide (TPR) repeat protein
MSKHLGKTSLFILAFAALKIGLFSTPGYADTRAPWVGETLEGEKCIGKSIGFGPYDYRNRSRLPEQLAVVENAHFTPEVEALQTGNTSTAINDIGYTIMAWPNHHRALHSAIKYRMINNPWPEKATVPPAECQLQRAMAFSPEDPIPYMMYGLLLHRWQQYEKALFAYQVAVKLQPNDVIMQYNMGLTLVELEQYEEAIKVANAVYAAGMPLPGLKNKLIAAGQWPTEESKSGTEATEKAPPKVELQTPEASAGGD